MTSMNKEAIVLKSDGAGRVQTPVERQAELVREFERSGLSGPRFAALAGVKYQTFATWRRRHGGSGVSREQRKPVVKPVFLEVTAACPAAVAAGPVVEITLPGGARASLHDAGQAPLLAALLKALACPLPC